MSEIVPLPAAPGRALPARALATLAVGALLVLAAVLPRGDMAPLGRMVEDPASGGLRFEHGPMGLTTAASVMGQLAVLLLAASVLLGRDLPPARRLAARTRVRAHAWVGASLLALALAHTALLLVQGSTRGWAPGLLALAALAAHGALGAWRRRATRAWGPDAWRLAQAATAWAAVAFTAEHVLLASWHFGLASWGHGA